MPGPDLGTVLLVSHSHTQAKGISPADISYLVQAQAMQLSSQDQLHASALSQVFIASLCGAGKQQQQLCCYFLRCRHLRLLSSQKLLQGSQYFHAGLDLIFLSQNMNSCSFSSRCNRKPLESFISERPLDKELGEQSSVPKGVVGKQAEAVRRSITTF